MGFVPMICLKGGRGQRKESRVGKWKMEEKGGDGWAEGNNL